MLGKLGRVNGHSGEPAELIFSGLSQQARYEHNTAFYYKKIGSFTYELEFLDIEFQSYS